MSETSAEEDTADAAWIFFNAAKHKAIGQRPSVRLVSLLSSRPYSIESVKLRLKQVHQQASSQKQRQQTFKQETPQTHRQIKVINQVLQLKADQGRQKGRIKKC